MRTTCGPLAAKKIGTPATPHPVSAQPQPLGAAPDGAFVRTISADAAVGSPAGCQLPWIWEFGTFEAQRTIVEDEVCARIGPDAPATVSAAAAATIPTTRAARTNELRSADLVEQCGRRRAGPMRV